MKRFALNIKLGSRFQIFSLRFIENVYILDYEQKKRKKWFNRFLLNHWTETVQLSVAVNKLPNPKLMSQHSAFASTSHEAGGEYVTGPNITYPDVSAPGAKNIQPEEADPPPMPVTVIVIWCQEPLPPTLESVKEYQHSNSAIAWDWCINEYGEGQFALAVGPSGVLSVSPVE